MHDNRKIEDAVLALVHLNAFKDKSVVLTDEGVRPAEELFNTLFAPDDGKPRERRPSSSAGSVATVASDADIGD